MEITKEYLIKEYIENDKSINQIARDNFCRSEKISLIMNELGIPRKQNKKKRLNLDNVNKLKELGFIVNQDYIGIKKYTSFKCFCGNEFKARPASILSGQTTSCGCKQTKQNSNHWKGFNDIYGFEFKRYQSAALDRGLDFSITIEDVWKLYEQQNRKCRLSGLEISWSNKKKAGTASIDRIDNNRGYTLDNIQIVHKLVNMMKKHYTNKDFIYVCYLIGKNYDFSYIPDLEDVKATT